MKKRFYLLIFIVIFALTSLSCSSGVKNTEKSETKDAPKLVVSDAKGRKIKLDKEVKSIVCLGVGSLRYTAYMDALDLVVGVEDYEKERNMTRLYNYVGFDKIKDLAVIGTRDAANVEEIIKLKPDLIVMSKFYKQDSEEVEKKTGLPVFVVPTSDTTLDNAAFETIEMMGKLYNREKRADELSEYLHALKEDLEKRTRDIKDQDKKSVYIGGVSFKGHHGFEGTEANYGPFTLIGAKNLADTTGQKGAFNIDLEKVLAWNPEIIFIDYNGMKLINEDYKKNPSFYTSLDAVKNSRVYAQISFRSSASNLETALADAYYAGKVLYPESFKDIDIEGKTGEIFNKILGTNPYPDLKEAGFEFKEIKLGE